MGIIDNTIEVINNLGFKGVHKLSVDEYVKWMLKHLAFCVSTESINKFLSDNTPPAFAVHETQKIYYVGSENENCNAVSLFHEAGHLINGLPRILPNSPIYHERMAWDTGRIISQNLLPELDWNDIGIQQMIIKCLASYKGSKISVRRLND